jgi:hypothetical protein
MIAGGCGRETTASIREALLPDRQEGAEAMRGVCLTQSCFKPLDMNQGGPDTDVIRTTSSSKLKLRYMYAGTGRVEAEHCCVQSLTKATGRPGCLIPHCTLQQSFLLGFNY